MSMPIVVRISENKAESQRPPTKVMIWSVHDLGVAIAYDPGSFERGLPLYSVLDQHLPFLILSHVSMRTVGSVLMPPLSISIFEGRPIKALSS